MVFAGYTDTAATAERDAWKSPLITGRVTTTDTAAIPGYSLQINIFGINSTYRIERVTSRWDTGRAALVHTCDFATKRRDLVNLLLTF